MIIMIRRFLFRVEALSIKARPFHTFRKDGAKLPCFFAEIIIYDTLPVKLSDIFFWITKYFRKPLVLIIARSSAKVTGFPDRPKMVVGFKPEESLTYEDFFSIMDEFVRKQWCTTSLHTKPPFFDLNLLCAEMSKSDIYDAVCWGISFEEFCIRNLAIKHKISLRKSAQLYFKVVNPSKEQNLLEAKAEKEDDPKNVTSAHENRVEDQQGESVELSTIEEGKGSK